MSWELLPLNETEVNQSASNTYRLLLERSNRCWARNPGFLSDGVVVQSYGIDEGTAGFVIYARWNGTDIGTTDTWTRVTITPKGSTRSNVLVTEVKTFPGSHPSLGKDIPRWLDGDSEC